ncbi:hypothetical protein GF376_01280 [Candidatus Peregrinibacteria bacterium]|nr:hypothetical protein [Candidatus Peregrinibacteria bacterium]
MKKYLKFWTSLFKHFQKDEVDQLAAAISFYATFSLIPIAVIAVGIAGIFYDRTIAKDWLFENMSKVIGDDKVPFWVNVFENTFTTSSSIWAILISVVILFFISSGLFVQIKNALNRIFKTKDIELHGFKKFFRNSLLPFLMVLSSGIILFLVIFAQTFFTLLGDWIREYIDLPSYYSQLVFSTIIITGIFAGVYKLFAKISIDWKHVLIGGLIAAILLQIGIYLISIFFDLSGVLQLYSAAASIVAVLYWIFFSTQIFLFGAEIVYQLHVSDKKNK